MSAAASNGQFAKLKYRKNYEVNMSKVRKGNCFFIINSSVRPHNEPISQKLSEINKQISSVLYDILANEAHLGIEAGEDPYDFMLKNNLCLRTCIPTVTQENEQTMLDFGVPAQEIKSLPEHSWYYILAPVYTIAGYVMAWGTVERVELRSDIVERMEDVQYDDIFYPCMHPTIGFYECVLDALHGGSQSLYELEGFMHNYIKNR